MLICNVNYLSIVCKNVVCNVETSSSNTCDYLHYPWHIRLGHVNFEKVSFVSKHDLILNCPPQVHNCKTCMLNKITRSPFKSVVRKSE